LRCKNHKYHFIKKSIKDSSAAVKGDREEI